jgi:hypothetical protein
VTETTDLLNAGEVLEALGQVWTLSHVGPGVRSKFSAWLKMRARKELKDQRSEGILDAADYTDSLDRLEARMTAGAFNWGSPLNPSGMGSAIERSLNEEADGRIRLVQLLLEKAHGQVSPDKVLEILGDQPDASVEAVKLCLQALPNGPAPDAPAKPGK